MESSVRAASRSRLRSYPAHIAACAGEASVYAQCVTAAMGEVKKNDCKEEFVKFKDCVRAAAKKAGTRL